MLYQAQSPVGAGLLAIRAPRSNRCAQVWPSQASPLPPIMVRPLNPLPSPTPCGSGLARDKSAVVQQVRPSLAIAGKPAPTISLGQFSSTLTNRRICTRS